MKSVLKKVTRAFFSEYHLIRLYYQDAEQIEVHPPSGVELRTISGTEMIERQGNDQELRDHAWYGNAQEYSRGFGLWDNGKLVATCWFWTSRHPKLPQRFVRIKDNEAVLVDILTEKASRGRGYATLLIDFATSEMQKGGYRTLWTWIWHSNVPSIRAFSKANWRYSHFQVELKLPATQRVLTIRLWPNRRLPNV